MTSDVGGEFGGVLLIGQRKMNALVLEELEKYPCVQARFGQKVVGIEDLEGEEEVMVMTAPQLDFARPESLMGIWLIMLSGLLGRMGRTVL